MPVVTKNNGEPLLNYEGVMEHYGQFRRVGRYQRLTEKLHIPVKTEINCRCDNCGDVFSLMYRSSYSTLLKTNITICKFCKRRKTKLQKYGNPFYTNREAAEKTMIEKYGVPHAGKSEALRKKSRETKLKRYGSEYFNNPEKRKIYNLKKYGKEGRPRTDQDKLKLSKVKRDFYTTDAGLRAKKLQSQKAKERFLNRENHPMFGRKMTEDSRKRMIESNSSTWADKILNGYQSSGKYYQAGNFISRTGKRIHYRSSYERLFYFLIDHSDDVISFQPEPFSIRYTYKGLTHRYIPDLLIEYEDGRKHLIEIKPSKLRSTERNQCKFSEGQRYCSNNQMKWFVISEGDLWGYLLRETDGSFFCNLPIEFKEKTISKLLTTLPTNLKERDYAQAN
jgi:hypothetical protein